MSGINIPDKISPTINIKHAVPLVLDLEQMNYDIWREFFEIHCIAYGVDHHLCPPTDPVTPPTDKEKEKSTAESAAAKAAWLRADSSVRSWMYGVLSIPLVNMIFKKQATALDVWECLEKVFRENKASRSFKSIENSVTF